jgi:hypothetical protein
MADIIKKVENLKPGKNYIFSVRTKNTDLNAYSENVNSILVSIPKDSTIPGLITNLNLYASFENVMFAFDFSNELDIAKYEYELYDNSSGTGTPVSSGFNLANVFSVAVSNSTDTQTKNYWGRVRTVDTSENVGPWTSLVQTDQSTPLINSQYISSLTASKITAGTIGAHTITMAGANSILKSNNYAAANATFGGTGWKISGDGKAVFNDASIRSSLDIGEDQGTSDATSFHVDVNGNMWLGSNSASLESAPFKVLNTGDVTANSLTLTGKTVLDPDSTASIYLTNNENGIGLYNDANTAFYVDANEQFSLGNKLTWSNSVLTVQGVLKLSDGSDVLDSGDVSNIAQDLVDEFGNAIYEDGFIGGLTISANTMYYGNGNFASGDTAFYVGKNPGGQANFSLGNKLSWDGSTLSVDGEINATSGNISGALVTGTIDAADISGVNITGVNITGSEINGTLYQNPSGRIRLPTDDSYIALGVDYAGSATQCYIYTGYDGGVAQGLRIDTSFNGSTVIAGQTWYINNDEFISARTIVGLDTHVSSGSVLVVNGGEVYRQASMRELKENIEDFSNVGLIDELRPRTFTWKAPKNAHKPETEEEKVRRESSVHIGFVAEEVEEVSDGLLSIYNYEVGGNGEVEMYKHLDILALTVAAVKDLRKRVSELEK